MFLERWVKKTHFILFEQLWSRAYKNASGIYYIFETGLLKPIGLRCFWNLGSFWGADHATASLVGNLWGARHASGSLAGWLGIRRWAWDDGASVTLEAPDTSVILL